MRDGRIAAVGANASGAAANAVRIDAGGRTVMPGFIDAHRHIIQGDPARWLAEQSAANMREYLAAGFTTVFSAIDPLDQILELRRRTESGETVGPRIVSAALVPLSRAVLGGGGVDPARTDPARAAESPRRDGARNSARGHVGRRTRGRSTRRRCDQDADHRDARRP